MRKFARHLPHYFSLIGILIFATFGYSLFQNDVAFQLAITFAVGVAYIAWGIIHHAIHKDLHLSVILEYFAVSIIGVVIITSLLLNK